jgi:hypothetical protein
VIKRSVLVSEAAGLRSGAFRRKLETCHTASRRPDGLDRRTVLSEVPRRRSTSGSGFTESLLHDAY